MSQKSHPSPASDHPSEDHIPNARQAPVSADASAIEETKNSSFPMDVKQYIPPARPPKESDTVEYVQATREDGPAINALYNKVFQMGRSLDHYEWKYWRNPAGPPTGMLARDKQTGRCIATGIGQRRRAWVNGKDSYGALLCESASDPDDRAGGHVWRKVMLGFGVSTNDDHGIVWAYGGQSSDAAIKIGSRWFGYRIMMELVPWEIRLGTRSSLRRHLGIFDGILGTIVAPILDRLYRARWRKRDFGLQTAEVTRFGPDYDELWERYRDLYPACFYRNAETLNWRYIDNPLWKHRVIEARRDGQIVGYMVWREWNDHGAMISTVLDFWHGKDQEVMQTLIDAARRKALAGGSVFLRFALQEGGPEHQAFQSFRSGRKSPHERVDKIICTPMPGSTPMDQPMEAYEQLGTVLFGKNWFYTQGDCDYRD